MNCRIVNCDDCPHEDCVLSDAEALERMKKEQNGSLTLVPRSLLTEDQKRERANELRRIRRAERKESDPEYAERVKEYNRRWREAHKDYWTTYNAMHREERTYRAKKTAKRGRDAKGHESSDQSGQDAAE